MSQDISTIIGTSPKTKQKYQQLAHQLQVKVEDIEHPPFEIVDNTDDIEPKPANIIIKNEVTTIHNQIFIQSPQQTMDIKMPLINQQTPQSMMSSTHKSKMTNFIQAPKDQNMLTNSTLNPTNSFLPKIYQQPSHDTNNNKNNQNLQNGYISDFYKQNKQINIKRPQRENNQKSDKNSNQYTSDQSEKRLQNAHQQLMNNGYSSNGSQQQMNSQLQPHQQHSSGQKIVDKKFFRSKIDFMAPIKSLQNRQNNQNADPLLSDDSYQDPPAMMGGQIQARSFQRNVGGSGFGGPPTVKEGSDQEISHTLQPENLMQRTSSVSKRSINKDYHNQIVSKYANLTQIQEETIHSSKSKGGFFGASANQTNTSFLNNSLGGPQSQIITGNNNTNNHSNPSVKNYGLISLNRNGIGNRKQSNNTMNGNNALGGGNISYINNANQIMGVGPKSNPHNPKKSNMSMDQGYPAMRNNKQSPLRLPNLKMAYKREALVPQHSHGGRLCAVCARKHNPNQPHIVQSVPPNKQKLLQRGPMSLNKSQSRGGAISRSGVGKGGMNNNNVLIGNRSQRSLSTSRNRAGSQSGRQLSVNNSQRSLLGSRSNMGARGGAGPVIQQSDYNQIDKLRSVNKLRTLPRKPSASDFSRNYKSLSPRVSMISRGKVQQNNNAAPSALYPRLGQTNNNPNFKVNNQLQQMPKSNPSYGNAMTPKQTVGKATFGIVNQNPSANQNNNSSMLSATQDEPELVCREKELDPSVEDEIKDGFFELRQKFKGQGNGESSIYVSHVVLHAKHPIFCKLEIDTLKNLLTDSSIIYLAKDQVLYKSGGQDNFVYFILFGRLNLLVPPVPGLNEDIKDQTQNNSNNLGSPRSLTDSKGKPISKQMLHQMQSTGASLKTQVSLGKANIGWTIGEEVLYDKNMQIRQESCVALIESCLLGIQKSKLAIIQKALLDKGNQKDYFVIESVLKGNFLIKSNWRKDMHEYYSNSVKSRSTPGQSQIGNEDIMNPTNNNYLNNLNEKMINQYHQQQQQQQQTFLT